MKYDWSKERLMASVKESNCWFEWLRKLGIPQKGCNYRTLKQKAQLYGIDTSHFNKIYARTHNGQRILKNRSDEEIFSMGARINKESVKKAYIERKMGNSPKCELCGITKWNDKKIIFQLHHKDGNNKNHTLKNLILLCPNCHSQTENYTNKKR